MLKKQIVVYSRSGNPNEAIYMFKYLGIGDEFNKLNIVGTNSAKYFAYMVKNDFSVGFGVKSNFSFTEDDGIRVKRLSDVDLSPCFWSLIYNINKKMTAADKEFILLLEKYCNELKKNT